MTGTVTVSWDQTVGGADPAHLLSASSLSGPRTDQGISGAVRVPISGTEFFEAVIP